MTETSRFAPGQTLLIDADDTLWENNIYFERAIAAFISYIDHKEYTREEVRAKLDEVERENVRQHGYGLSSFRRWFQWVIIAELPPVPKKPIVCVARIKLKLHPEAGDAAPKSAAHGFVVDLVVGRW